MLILGLQKTTLLDYPGHIASTIFTGGCNFRCPYCHNGDLVLNPAACESISEETIFEHLNKRRGTLEGVCITGGEPTLQPDLIDFISKIKSMGLLVKLDTNGTNPKVIEELLQRNLIDYIAMDIKHCPNKYNEVACMPSFSLDSIRQSVSIIMNSHIDYEFRSTVTSELHSDEDIMEIGAWLKGARAYYLQAYRESDNVINPIFSAPSKDKLLTWKNILEPLIHHVDIRGVD